MDRPVGPRSAESTALDLPVGPRSAASLSAVSRTTRIRRGLALAVVIAAPVTAGAMALAAEPDDPGRAIAPPAAPVAPPAPILPPTPVQPANPPPEGTIAWQRSQARGLPFRRGRLIDGVQLPDQGAGFWTWDPVEKVSPNRGWRRWGTDRLVRTLLDVLSEFRAAHPDAPRVGIGDLSRPRGGSFGRRYGSLGHSSHQNGLDADVYYPRLDRRERRPHEPQLVDRELAQALVDAFVDAGAQYVFVGPRLRLRRPGKVVIALTNHDDHLHVRIPADP